MGRLFFLVVLAACVVGGQCALLGAKKCTYGPSYWCSGLKKAKECNAVRHCIQTVWEKQTLPEDHDDICTLCKDMVQQARDQLLSNETQEEIKEVFDGSCRLIPIKVVADECVHLAEDFIPELVDTLASQMNPQVVCATAGLCNNVEVDMLLEEHYMSNHPFHENSIMAIQHEAVQHTTTLAPPKAHDPMPGDCEACKDFVSRTIRLVKTHSRAELMDRLFAICGRLGSLSDGCMALVQANFNDIYTFLTQQLTPNDFCDLVEMCEARMHDADLSYRPVLTHTDDVVCDFCESIVQHWRDILTANTTKEEFKEILDGLCRQAGSFSSNCLSLVDEYYEPLYDMLVSEIEPKQICESVGLCGIHSVFKKQPPVWTVLGVEEPDVMAQVPLLPAIPLRHEPGYTLVGQDEAAAEAHERQGSLLVGGDEAAAILFEQHQEASQSGPQVVHVPLSRPGIAVSHVGTSGVVAPAVGKGHVNDDNMCVMCEFVMQFLRNMLEQKDTREDIENAVESVCQLLPQTVAEECEDYVEAYGEEIIELLAQEIDPAKVCQMIQLCPSKTKAAVELPAKDDVVCVMCEYAMNQLQHILEDNSTEEQIREALDNLCTILPDTVKSDCQFFVDTYSEQIIHMLVNDLQPSQVCTALHLCTGKTKGHQLQEIDSTHQLPISRMFVGVLSPQGHQLQEIDSTHQLPISRMFVGVPSPQAVTGNSVGGVSGTKQHQSMSCVLCEFVMKEVDDYLKENTTQDFIIEALDFVCAHLPATIMNDCIDYVDTYGAMAIDLIADEELDPKLVCQALKLCNPPSFAGLMRATRAMSKCEICEAIVTKVDDELKDEDTETMIDNLLEKVCKYLPFNSSTECRNMVEVYGPFLANMLAEVLEPKKVCEELHLCQAPAGHPSLLGRNKCTWGPSYWCQTQIHASACSATEHCQQTVWRMKMPLI